MSEKDNKLPLGLLLQNAGLISKEQLETSLELQAQYTQMKLGEILVLQEGIRAKTIRFFVDSWHDLITQGQQFPLGYYLKNAFLLSQQQVEVILQEQKTNPQKFGAIAVEKGWVEQDTVDFFLNNLTLKLPGLISFGSLEEYNRQVLHLDKKYANYSLVLSRIIAWTGGNLILTKAIAQVFTKANFNIPNGSEIKVVDRFIEGFSIGKWQTTKAAEYIRSIKHSLINNSRCDSRLLLKEYQTVLLSGNKKYSNTPEQNELLLLGLIVSSTDKLQIANIIYQQVFNRDFITQELSKKQLETTSITSIEPSEEVRVVAEYASGLPILKIVEAENNLKIESNSQLTRSDLQNTRGSDTNTTEPLTRMSSLITLAAIVLLIPLFLTINNHYSSLAKKDTFESFKSTKKAGELQQFCNQLSFTNSNSALDLISQLEINKEELLQDFPNKCETALNRLRVLAAPQLGKENRILEAIRHLCKVPANSEMYVDAEVWLKRWYNSSNWGKETKLYLEETSKYGDKNCPAAHFAEYES